jgi:hypothetical protein
MARKSATGASEDVSAAVEEPGQGASPTSEEAPATVEQPKQKAGDTSGTVRNGELDAKQQKKAAAKLRKKEQVLNVWTAKKRYLESVEPRLTQWLTEAHIAPPDIMNGIVPQMQLCVWNENKKRKGAESVDVETKRQTEKDAYETRAKAALNEMATAEEDVAYRLRAALLSGKFTLVKPNKKLQSKLVRGEPFTEKESKSFQLRFDRADAVRVDNANAARKRVAREYTYEDDHVNGGVPAAKRKAPAGKVDGEAKAKRPYKRTCFPKRVEEPGFQYSWWDSQDPKGEDSAVVCEARMVKGKTDFERKTVHDLRSIECKARGENFCYQGLTKQALIAKLEEYDGKEENQWRSRKSEKLCKEDDDAEKKAGEASMADLPLAPLVD